MPTSPYRIAGLLCLVALLAGCKVLPCNVRDARPSADVEWVAYGNVPPSHPWASSQHEWDEVRWCNLVVSLPRSAIDIQTISREIDPEWCRRYAAQ